VENKILDMQKEIEELKIQLDQKQEMLQEFRQEAGDFSTVGHLKAHMDDLET
jgi:cell division protein FtsL